MISEHFPWLTTIILFPLVAVLPIPFLPDQQGKTIRWYALGVAVTELLFILYTFGRHYDLQQSNFQLVETYSWVSQLGLNWSVAVDGLSMPLVVLTGLVYYPGNLGLLEYHLSAETFLLSNADHVWCPGGCFRSSGHTPILFDVGIGVGSCLLAHLNLGWVKAVLCSN